MTLKNYVEGLISSPISGNSRKLRIVSRNFKKEFLVSTKTGFEISVSQTGF